MRRFIALLLVFCLLLPAAGAGRPARAAETDYLVKFRSPPDGAPFHTVGSAELERLLAADALVWYAPDETFLLAEPEDDTSYYGAEKWDLDLIGAGAAMALGQTGKGVRVGVIDSGISPHADLRENLVPGRNYISSAADPADTEDVHGHGTRVAGLIAAHSESGAIGAAPGATVVPLKCTDAQNVKVSAICRAIYGGVDDFKCDILNISIGLSANNPALREAVDYAAAHDVLVIAAVGNSGNRTVYYPAGYDNALGVGAVDQYGAVYRNSNHNDSVSLTAPGVNVLSTRSLGGYTTSTGTSFAVPLVSAAAAVLKGADPALSREDLCRLLTEGAVDAGAEGPDIYYGYGIVNIGRSLALLPESLPAAPSVFDETGGCPRDETCPLQPFSDLRPDAWYHDGVHFSLQTGVMRGVGDGRFDPDGTTTRAMLVTVLHRLAGDGSSTADGAPFSDLRPGAYYAEAVSWAWAQGIVTGFPDGSFHPDEPVTREQLAAIVYRFAGTPAAEAALEDFPDAEAVQGYALDAMRWAVGSGLIRGVAAEDGSYLRPGGSAARAQLASVIFRYADTHRAQFDLH